MMAVNGHPRVAPPRATAAYVARAVEEECERVATAGPQQANSTLHRAAVKLGSMVGADWLSREQVEAALLAAAAQRGKDKSEARATIKSGLDWGERHPRQSLSLRQPATKATNENRSTTNCGTRVSDRRRLTALKLWRASGQLAGSSAEVYLSSRGIRGAFAQDLRFGSAQRMPDGTTHPVLVAKVRVPATGQFLAVHRIAIKPDGSGKAEVAQAKASLGSTSGGAVVFGDLKQGGALLEGEGIETTLSVCQAMGLPGIATLSAGTLGKAALPPDCPVIILADRGSEQAARAGAHRRHAEGRTVRIAIPPANGGKDFNDTLQALGTEAVKEAITSAVLFQPEPKSPAYVARRLSEVVPQPVRWLWKGMFARGKLNLIAGQPGRGKSQLALHFAATVSTGGRWPDGSPCEQGSVIIITCEDEAADTIVPRLMALGADLKACHILDGSRQDDGGTRPFGLKSGIEALEMLAADKERLALVIIDPVSAYLDGSDSHKNADVRAALLPLQALAELSSAAVLLVSHLNKGTTDVTAMARVSGSGAFVAVCRSAWLVDRDPVDSGGKRRILAPMKNNIGNDETGFAFDVEPAVIGEGISTSRVRFIPGTLNITADALLKSQVAATGRSSALEEAMAFLREWLNAGPVAATAIRAAADQAGHRWRTVEKAKKKLGVRSSKTPDGWVWRLPEPAAAGDHLR